MNENNSYPLIVRGANSVIEIPERLRAIDAIKNITDKTRGRFSSQTYTIEEVGLLLGKGDSIDTAHASHLDLLETVKSGHTTLIQLIADKQWRIRCLVSMVSEGWSALETTSEGQVGIFYTGTRLPLGHIPKQYLIHHSDTIDIGDLIEKQRAQPDHIAWRDGHF